MRKPLSQEDIRKYNFRLWKILIGGIVVFALFIVSVGFGLFGALPSFRDIEHPKSNQASEVVTEDGKILGTYFVQNRSNVTYNEISPNVINALIATEDVRFKEHSGIDFKRTFTIFLYAMIGKKTRRKYHHAAACPEPVLRRRTSEKLCQASSSEIPGMGDCRKAGA